MAKPDLKRFKLLKRSPAGKISVQEITAEAIQVEGSFAYTIVDASTGKLPKSLQARRVGDDLQVLADGQPAVRLEGFYKPVNGNTAFDGSGELFAPVAGSYDSGYALLTGDELNASDKVVIGKADAADSSWSLTSWGWAGLIGLGVAAAAGRQSSSDDAGSPGNGGSGGGNNGGGNNGGGNNGGGNNGGGNNGGGNTGGGNTGGGSTGGQAAAPVPVSARAGFIGIEGLGGARVQILHDANGNGIADAGEGTSAIILARSDVAARGQFEIPATLPGPAYNASRSLLQLTSSGGTTLLSGVGVPLTGPVQGMTILTRPIDPDATRFDAVLSPLTTLGSHLLRTQLQNGVPADLDKTAAYGEHLTLLSDVLGLSMAADRLLSSAPVGGAVQRIIIERQLNALLVATVALASGKADSQSPGWSGAATAEIAARLGMLVTQQGSMDLADPAQLQNLLAATLPLSLPVAGVLAEGLAPLMSALAMAADGDHAASLAAQVVLPSLANTLALRHAGLIAGTLDDPAVMSALQAELQVIGGQIARAVRDAAPSTRVIVDASGAYLDRNADGRLDAQDELNGTLVAASFSSGGNADLAAGRVGMTWQFLPVTAQGRPPATLTADDRVEIMLDAVNSGHRLDVSWSASDANLMLKAVQDKGLVTDLSVAARERGSSAVVSIGRFSGVGGLNGDPVTAALGAVSLLAAGSANGAILSTVDLRLAFGTASDGSTGGRIAGPLRLQAGGTQARASANVQSLAALELGDVAVVSTALNANASGYLKAGGSGQLKLGQASLASHAMGSGTELTLESGSGGVRTERGVSALSTGLGSTSSLTIRSTDGSLTLGTGSTATSADRMISVVASGDAYRVPGATDDFSLGRASMLVASEAGAIAVRDVSVVASGRAASAALTLQSMQGSVLIDGATRVIAAGQAGSASLTLIGASQSATLPAVSLTGAVTLEAAGDETDVALNVLASAGSLRLAGNSQLRATGANAVASATLSAAGGALTVEGNWALEAGSYGAQSDLILRQPSSGASALRIGTVDILTHGALSGASVQLERAGTASGAISTGELSVLVFADHRILADQVVVRLETAAGNFVTDGSIRVLSSGVVGGVKLDAGSAASDVMVTGSLNQYSLAYRSRSQVAIESGMTLSIAEGIGLYTDGAGSELILNLNAERALVTGNAATTALEGGVTVDSQGANNITTIALTTDGATVRFGGDVELTRKALTAAGLDRSTQLKMSSGTVNVTIDGDFVMLADAASVNGALLANLHAKSVHDAAVLPATTVPPAELASIVTGGHLLVRSDGFNTLAALTANVTGPRAMFDVGADFSVISGRSGDLAVRGYGATSKVMLAGNGAFLKIANDWIVKSEELGNARSEFAIDLKGGSGGESQVGDDIMVSALGYGSRAVAMLSGTHPVSQGIPLAVTDRIDVLADGAGAVAVFSGNARITAGGGLSVIADSGAGAPGGAYAMMSAGSVQLGNGAFMHLDAVRTNDVAALKLEAGAAESRYRLGSASSAGKVYLDTGTAFATEIDIDLTSAGVAHIEIGITDRDLGMAEARAGLLSIDGFRTGIDRLELTEGTRLGATFRSASTVIPVTLDQFLLDAYQVIGSRTTSDPSAAAYYKGVVWRADQQAVDVYIAFDFDGVGLSGLIKTNSDIVNLNTPIDTPTGVAFNPYAPTRTVVSDPGSETNTEGSIVRSAVAIGAMAAEERNLVLASTNESVRLGSLKLSADHFGKASAALSGAANQIASVAVQSTTLEAHGLHSQAVLSMVSNNNNPSDPAMQGFVSLAGGLTISASGDKSSGEASLSGANYFVSIGSPIRVEAAGVESKAKFAIGTSAASGLTLVTTSDILVYAAGALAQAEFIYASTSSLDFDARRSLSVKAGGDATVATVTVDVRNGFIRLGSVDTVAEGGGARATASFGNADLSLHVKSTIAIGELQTRAQGEESQATSSVNATDAVTIFAAVTTNALTDKSTARTTLKSLKEGASIGSISVESDGVGANASVRVELGRLVTTPIVDYLGDGTQITVGSEASVIGNGDVAIGSGVQVTATRFDGQALVDIKARGGDVTLGTVDPANGNLIVSSSGADSDATVFLQAGSTGQYILLNATADIITAVGVLSVGGRIAVAAEAEHSRSSASLSSHAGALSVGEGVSITASGAYSEARMYARSFSFNDTRVTGTADLPQAPVSVGGALAVEASGTQAMASALLQSARGAVEVEGGLTVTSVTVGAGSDAVLDAQHGTIRVGGEARVAAIGSLSDATLTLKTGAPTVGIPNEGNIRFAQGLGVMATGTGAHAETTVNAQSSGTVAVGGALRLGAAAEQAIAMLNFSASGADSGGTDGAALVRALTIAGRLQVEATAAHALASAALEASSGSWAATGVSVLAAGNTSEAQLTATEFAAAAIGGTIQVLGTGENARANAALGAAGGNLSVAGGVLVLATGDASVADMQLLVSAGKLEISGDVNVAALGESSLASLEMSQRPSNDLSVAGTIRVTADSGAGSAVGAKATAVLALGRVEAAGTELLVSAVQSADKASVALELFEGGGDVQLGGAGQSGTAALTLLGKTLVDEVAISFEGTAGKAMLNFAGENINATAPSSLSVMAVDGFRIEQDSIRFEYDGRALTSFTSTDAFNESGFILDALNHFADDAVGKGLYAAAISGDLYIAYDYDGSGVDGVIALDDVTLAQFRQYISSTGLG